MKRYILVLLILLISSPGYTVGPLQGIVGGVGEAAPPAAGLIGESATGTAYSGTGHYWFYRLYTTTTPGTVSYCHAKASQIAIGKKINAAIYTAAGSKMSDGTSVSGIGDDANVYNITLDTPQTLVAATQYYLVWATDSAQPAFWYVAGGSNAEHYDTAPSNIDSLDSTLPAPSGNDGGAAYVIWCDNSPT